MAERKCEQCNAVLSEHNDGTLCFPCQKKKQEELQKRIGDKPYYDIYDMSFFLGVSPEQVKRLGRDKKIPGRIPGIKEHRYVKAIVDLWISSGGEITKPEVLMHYSDLALTALKLVEILDHYYQAHQFDIGPLISTDFPFTTHLPDSPVLNEREFSNLMDHLKGEIPELASIAAYPSACRKYFADKSKSGHEMPIAKITGDIILKLKLIARQGQFPGRCPDCPR